MRLLKCRKGATLVEFAFLVPVYFLILFAIVEFSLVLFTSSMLEGAVREASRFGITGSDGNGGVSREEYITQIIEKNTITLIEPEKMVIETQVYNQFDQIGQAEPYADDNGNGGYDTGESFTDINGNGAWDEDMGLAGLGGPGDVVVYTINYPWSIMTPMMGKLIGDNGVLRLSSSIAVRNEPYNFNVLN